MQWSAVGLAVLMSLACYHATIETGATPSTQTVTNEWASGWVYGLVPPNTVETAAKCPNGVAKVETQHSFPNMLVQFLTLGIYTPMTIVATCSTGGRTSQAVTPARTVAVSQGTDAVRAAFAAAAVEAAKTGAPVLVQVENGR